MQSNMCVERQIKQKEKKNNCNNLPSWLCVVMLLSVIESSVHV